MIETHDLASQSIYDQLVFLTLGAEEGIVLSAYYDQKGIPTIGVGFNLQVANSLTQVLTAFGFYNPNLTKSQKQLEQQYQSQISSLINGPNIGNTQLDAQLNQLMASLAGQLPMNVAPQSTFTYTGNAQVLSTLVALLPKYENQVNKIYSPPFPLSLERVALLSLDYNGSAKLIGPKTQFAQDINDDNRAEAWYQIRYGSNPDMSLGVEIRRLFESSLINLYDPGGVTDSEANQIFTMAINHFSTIFSDTENNFISKCTDLINKSKSYVPYQTAIAYAASQVPGFAVQNLADSLAPAANFLLTDSSAQNSGPIVVLPGDVWGPSGEIDLTSYDSSSVAAFIQTYSAQPGELPFIYMNSGNDLLYVNPTGAILNVSTGSEQITFEGTSDTDYIVQNNPGVLLPNDNITFLGVSIAGTLSGSGGIDHGLTYTLDNGALEITKGNNYLSIYAFNNGDFGVDFINAPTFAQSKNYEGGVDISGARQFAGDASSVPLYNHHAHINVL